VSPLESRLLGREEIADGTMAFHFARPAGFAFKAGQAVDVVLAEAQGLDTAAGRHTFSLANAPSEERLTVATRLRDSEFKRALANLPVGATVNLDGPFGSLLLHGDANRPAVFVAGGIGITPFMSILRQAGRDGASRRLVLLYANHRPEDSAWLGELQELERRMPGFQLLPVMTAMNRSSQPWAGLCGRIDAAMLRGILAEHSRPVCYATGSPSMVAAMRKALNEAGIDDDDIRSEEFHGY
jgi:ferredoxin-NADP reductase